MVLVNTVPVDVDTDNAPVQAGVCADGVDGFVGVSVLLPLVVLLPVADATMDGNPTMSDIAGETNMAAATIAAVKVKRTRFFILIFLLKKVIGIK